MSSCSSSAAASASVASRDGSGASNPPPGTSSNGSGAGAGGSSSSNKRKNDGLDQSPGGNKSAHPPKRSKLQVNPIHEEFSMVNGDSVCKHCPAKLKGKNTTTLVTHIKAKHTKVHANYIKKKEDAVKEVEFKKKAEVVINKPTTAANNTISSSILGTPPVSSLFGSSGSLSKYTYQDPRQKKITKDIALLISTTTLPVSVVSAPCFKKLVTGLNPHARVPERKMMRKEINQIWDQLRGALQKAINIARKVSITCDIWTSKNMVASYLGITIHFFNSQTRTRAAHRIACREFPNPHTGQEIAKKILDICKEFQMDDKVEYISCDNGSNMVASFKFMEEMEDTEEETVDVFDQIEEDSDEEIIDLEELLLDVNDNVGGDQEENELPDVEVRDGGDQDLETELQAQEEEIEQEIVDHEERDIEIDVEFKVSRKKRGRCFAHTGQLAINKVNKMKNQIFGRVLAKAKRYVAKYRKSPKAKYALRKTSFKKRLNGFCKTRWHSDLAMSKSLVEAGEKEDKPLAKLTEVMNWDIEITVADIRMLKTYNTLMEPFANKTNLLGGEKYSTIQLVLPTLMELLNHLEDVGTRTGGGVLRYCNKLKSEIREYFKHVLDPTCDEFDPIYHLATFLDPIFSQVLTQDQNKIAIAALKARIKGEMIKKGEDWENILEHTGEGETDSTKKTLFRGFKHISNLIASAQSSDKAKSTPFSRDLELYKAEIQRVLLARAQAETPVSTELHPEETREDEESPIDDPLDYWSENESKYETLLAQIAEDILCIPATSTPSERLFSISGLLASGVMSNISPINLEKRVLIKVNVIPGDI